MRYILLSITLLVSNYILCGCAVSLSSNANKPRKASKIKPMICELRIQVKITDKLAPYLAEEGNIKVLGAKGYTVSKEYPVRTGMQMVIFPDMQAGRYIVEISYGTIVATKGIILCCNCHDNWQVTCMADLTKRFKKSDATSAGYSSTSKSDGYTGYSYDLENWGIDEQDGQYWAVANDHTRGYTGEGTYTQKSSTRPPKCSFVSPCGEDLIFVLPEDAIGE